MSYCHGFHHVLAFSVFETSVNANDRGFEYAKWTLNHISFLHRQSFIHILIHTSPPAYIACFLYTYSSLPNLPRRSFKCRNTSYHKGSVARKCRRTTRHSIIREAIKHFSQMKGGRVTRPCDFGDLKCA